MLIALLDPLHVHHDPAHEWFDAVGKSAWATCPLKENGVIRIVGHPRYPGSPGSPVAVAPSLTGLCALPGHVFWPDAISLCSHAGSDPTRLLVTSQVTDTYLLALAQSRGGYLASFDRRLVTDAVADGRKALRLIS